MKIFRRVLYGVLTAVALSVGVCDGLAIAGSGPAGESEIESAIAFSFVATILSGIAAGLLFGMVGLLEPTLKDEPGSVAVGSSVFRRLIFGVFCLAIVLGFLFVSHQFHSAHPVRDGIFGRGEVAGGVGLSVWLILYTRREKGFAILGLILLLLFTTQLFAGVT